MPLKGAEIGVGTLGASFVLACGAVYQWIQRVDDYAGSSGGALGPLAAFGRSVVPRRGRGRTRPRTSSRR